MYSFEGDFRRKPQQSLRGASKKEEKTGLLKRAQEERKKREDFRVQQENAVIIQKVFRGYKVRNRQNAKLRAQFDGLSSEKGTLSADGLVALTSQICHFYRNNEDGNRLVWLCQQLIKRKDVYLQKVLQSPITAQQQIRTLLHICLRYLESISRSSQPIAIPMRMLELYTSPSTYKGQGKLLQSVWQSLIDNNYFDSMRVLLNCKVPSSLEKSSKPPTPVSASIYELVMAPISYAASSKDRQFSNQVLCCICKSLLCPAYSEQISQFLLPAMAYGKYPFPFVDLIQALISHTAREGGSGKNMKPQKRGGDMRVHIDWSQWLLGAFLNLGDKHIESLGNREFSQYLEILQRLLPHLQSSLKNDDIDSSDSEEDMDISDPNTEVGRITELKEDCILRLDSEVHVRRTASLVSTNVDISVIYSVAVICHCLMSQQKYSIHKRRLLYSLAFNPQFIRSLWRCCVSESTITATGNRSSLLMMLCRGLHMSDTDIKRIVPVLSTFCAMFSHSLHTLHDADFYGDNTEKKSSMPFTVSELVPMMIQLRDVCLGIIELAHPDARPTVNEDYKIALKRTGVRTSNNNTKENHKKTMQWGHLFKVTAALVRQGYTRDTRRSFCPIDTWLSDRVKIQADGPSQIYRAQDAVFTQRPFRTMQSLTKISQYDDEGGPPLSNRDVKNLVILTELPFVVAFEERVKILQKLISKDKEGHQGDMQHFLAGPSVTVMIRRNFIYEDAFEKLSPENEPNLKLKMRVQLVNAAGLDEAGIDGGGIFREFLSELLKTGFDPNRGFFKPNLKLKMRVQLVNAAGLDEAGIDGGGIFREFLNELLKTGFDPNRGFFSQTTDRLLYPNPQASVLVEDFTKHYYFLGRMLGKAIYENMLVELPFASFFLSKLLSRHSGDLDIHHLASLDPEMYKNLLFLKHYDGNIADLELDFTAVNNQFGDTKVEELKPGGRNIPVTADNRIEYIHLMADYKLNKQIRAHCIAFRNGMSDLINLEWLRMFDQHELQVLISGAAIPIDIEDLKQYTNYSGGYTADHVVIKMLWKIVEHFTDQQKRQLLKFITSCSRPPLLGFKDLYPPLCIHYGGNEPDRLPTASTCMNLLKLPECRDEQTLRHKLLYAIESGAGFELS